MRLGILQTLCGTAALAVSACLAAPSLPTATIAESSVVVSIADQKLTVSLVDAGLAFSSPCGNCTLGVSLQLGDGWTKPSKAATAPQVTSDAKGVRVRVTYPVPEQRQFELEIEARRDIPAIFVISRLRVLDSPRGQYYFWQTNLTGDHYLAPGARGIETVPFHTAEWDPIPWRDWWLCPGPAGGVAAFPTNVSGRCPGPSGGIFLHALPRSNTIVPGDSLNASFGLAGVKDAPAAADLLARAKSAGVAALDPFAEARRAGPSDLGSPAPKWLREAEVCNLFYHPAADWTDKAVNEKLRGFPFIIGSTPDKAALDRCHRAGVRLLHYVVYTCLLDTAMQVREGGKVYSEWSESIDNQARDLKDHPDWVCINAKGSIQKDAWGQAHGHPGLLNTCLHQKGLHEAAVRQVRMLMQMGYDGVFIDLAGPTVECYGPKFGKHTHPDGRTNTQAYEDLLHEIYAEVKRFGNDRVVIQNTCTATLPNQWAYSDAQMLEAFPYGEGSTELRAPWPELRWAAARNAAAVARGKALVALPYLGGKPPERLKAAALLSYAYTQMSGFLWADGFTLASATNDDPFATDLYRARLGRPTSEVRTTAGVQYRVFERGLAAINPEPWDVTVSLPVTGAGPLHDVGWGGEVTLREGAVALQMPPQSGRVLVRSH